MKKFFVVFCVAVAFSVYAQTQTLTVIRAVVGADLTITTSIPSIKTIDPGLTGATLGDVTISSNIAGAWRIVFSSSNSGAMIRVGGTERFPYRLNFGDTTGHNLAQNLTINKANTQVATTTSVSISYQTAASLSLPAGTYEDTLTISLSPQ
ncbi:MAG: hypothetical protein FD137_634 [Spirochaetes bacterium]|nr:MAG: hypothetical protein FD137_634 [Spirochaetota bacterium]